MFTFVRFCHQCFQVEFVGYCIVNTVKLHAIHMYISVYRISSLYMIPYCVFIFSCTFFLFECTALNPVPHCIVTSASPSQRHNFTFNFTVVIVSIYI